MSNAIGRVWELILYPDRLRPDWRSLLESYGVTGALSPLHNMDIWSEEDTEVIEGKHGAGELKEPLDDNYSDFIDMFRFVRKHTIFLSKVIDSLRYSNDCNPDMIAVK